MELVSTKQNVPSEMLNSHDEAFKVKLRKANSYFQHLEEYEKDMAQARVQKAPYLALFLIIIQVALSALKAPLYFMLDHHDILRVAWRQILIGVIYLSWGLPSWQQLRSIPPWQFLIACGAQAVYVASLSVSIEYIDMTISLMLYNSSVLIYCVGKFFLGSPTHKERLGVSLGLLSIIFILGEEVLFSVKEITGVVTALLGAASSLIYAVFVDTLDRDIPYTVWLSITRITPGIMLLMISLVVENSASSVFQFIRPQVCSILLLHVGLTGLIVNYIQTKVDKKVDTLTQKSISFLEPIFGCFYGYIFHEQHLPSGWVLVCMLTLIIAQVIMQSGRMENEAQDINMDMLVSTHLERDLMSLRKSIFLSKHKFDINMEK